jgi:hypothetical protein
MKYLILVRQTALFIILFSLTNHLFAQSDYEIVQSFKQKFQQLQHLIDSAKELEELNSLISDIDRFRNDYFEHKGLLDKSLYPDDFDESFDKLNLAFVIKNRDFTTIDVLQTENLQLKEQVSVLNKRNSELMNKIQEFEYTNKKDNKKLAELENLIEELKTSLRKRDKLIFSIVDSLMPKLMKEGSNLSALERGQIYIESENNNLIYNVKKLLQDNIQFVKVTTLEPDDLVDIRSQQEQFSEFWQDAGVNLVDIYAEKNRNAKEIKEIDSLYTEWNNSVEEEAWLNIRAEFELNEIHLFEFANGKEFTEVLISFMNEEIKNIGMRSPEESEKSYASFADSTWFRIIKPKWIPYLIENKMLQAEKRIEIKEKIAEWKGRLTPSSFDWIYVLVAVLAVAGFGFMNRKRMFKNKSNPK